MQPMCRYRDILSALIAVQVMVFVLSNIFLRGHIQPSVNMVRPFWQQEQLLLNYSMSAAAAEGRSEMSKRKLSEVGRDHEAHVSSYGANRIVKLFKKAVSSLPAFGSIRANVSTTVRNKTLHSSARSATDDEATDGCNRSAKEQIRLSSNLYPDDQTLAFFNIRQTDECKSSYLRRYFYYCRNAIVPLLEEEKCTLCPCIPRSLIGSSSVLQSEGDKWKGRYDQLAPGGQWGPRGCVARQRVAIIVPFRNRGTHLRVLLSFLHPFLQRQLLQYTIFVVEQHSPSTFNKGSLMNAGFLEIRSRRHFDCFIFHDVDMLPETDLNFYGCYKSPRHIGVYVNKFNYKLLYTAVFGGVTAFTERQFVKVNGYSNEFFGWGGEDDDMYNRLKWSDQEFLRFPDCVARYTMLKHRRDRSNPYSRRQAITAFKMRPETYKRNGLNSVAYDLVSYKEEALFTQILISLRTAPCRLKNHLACQPKAVTRSP